PALDQLPVIPAAAWVYLSWYPATAAVLFAGCETFRRAYLAYLLAFAVCIASHLLFPVTITRPAVPAEGGLSLRLLAWVYAADRPINLFPSFHAAVAAILWRLRPASRFGSAAVSAWTVALCAACVLTKQPLRPRRGRGARRRRDRRHPGGRGAKRCRLHRALDSCR